MNDQDKQLLRHLTKRIRKKYPNAQVRAFGSRARGDASADSDFDVCIILETMTPEDRRIVSDIAWEIGFDANTLVSTIVFSKTEFLQQQRPGNPLITNILREGIAA